MSIREKLQDFKRRLSDRKMYSIILVVIGAIAIWGLYQYKQAAEIQQRLDNGYNRAFYDMTGYVHNVEVLLTKAMLTSTPAATATTLQEAWRQANLAQTNLGQLPVNQPVLADVSKFLTQIGDFAYSLNTQNMYNKVLTGQEYETLDRLHTYAVNLGTALNELAAQLGSGRLQWKELERKGMSFFEKASKNMAMEQLENLNRQFQDYPSLIYDGPFSDHVPNIVPKGLGDRDVTVEEATERVKRFIGPDRVETVTNTGTNESTGIAVYSFEVKYKNAPDDQRATLDVTKKGGNVLWMVNNRAVTSATLTVDQAKDFASRFLEGNGFTNMKDTYYLKEDNTATINYAYTQNGVTIYPDLIKVKIALDNGETVGFESKSYLYSHTVRDIPTPAISEAQARAVISPRVQIQSSGLAIIPTESKNEIFVYEFKGKLKDRDFLVYVNALNGREERILMIIDTPNGILTI